MNLKEVFTEITNVLDVIDKDREEILRIHRKIIRHCSVAIKSIHRREFDIYAKKIDEIKIKLKELSNFVNKNLGVFFNYIRTPQQEYAEAVCFYSIINNQNLPTPSELNIDHVNYVLGLADVLGELRRYILDNIRNSKLEDLNKLLENMDDIHDNLFSLDYPKALTKDLRRKTDIGRNIIERTRADISLSIRMNELRNCIDDKL